MTHRGSQDSCKKSARSPAKKEEKKKKDEEADDEMNDETDEVLIRKSPRWHSVGILHLISPLYPPPLDDGQPPRVPCCVAFSIM